jgi:CheY-like chemotaxis protein
LKSGGISRAREYQAMLSMDASLYVSAIMPDLKTPSRKNVVLVVEPDPHVRAMAADVLEQEGFEVIEASSADYAATLLHSRKDVRVLLTEIASPGDLNGFDLARIAQAHNPHIVVIVVAGALPSGFTRAAPVARFVRKPYLMIDVIVSAHFSTRRKAGFRLAVF